MGAAVDWNGRFKGSSRRLNCRLGWLSLFVEVVFNYEAGEIWHPEVIHLDDGLLLGEVIKANRCALRPPAFKVVHKRLFMLVELQVIALALVCECLG